MQNIPIIYALDRNFVVPTLVSIISAVENNAEKLEIHLIIPQSDSGQMKLIEKELQEREIEYQIHPFSSSLIDKLDIKVVEKRRTGPGREAITLGTYQKLLIQDLIKLEKVVYIDGDTLVGDCLKDLYNVELENNFIAGVSDMSSRGILKETKLPFNEETKYINAGLMVLDLEKLREYNFFMKSMSAESKYRDRLNFVDQDIINIVLNGKVKLLPSHFNLQTWYKMKKKQVEINLKLMKKGILHCVGPVKPWHDWYIPQIKEIWESYAQKIITSKIETKKITRLQEALILSEILDNQEQFKRSGFVKNRIINHLLKRRKI